MAYFLWFVIQDQHANGTHVDKDPEASRARKVSPAHNVQPYALNLRMLYLILHLTNLRPKRCQVSGSGILL